MGGEVLPEPKKVPDVFSPAGYWAVSKEVADILREFDLGQTKLYPVELFRHDGKTPIAGRHEFLNLCEKKAAFEPSLSAKFSESEYAPPGTSFGLFGYGKDYDLTLNKTALVGPDLWLDTKLNRAVFLSNRLAKALDDAGFAKKMRLLKCHVADA
ncbi:hypothetical protein [Litoreibacter roseus]|uniref:Uncharacterized protein n=1 Tax=Litoreibacter roseus TaxID=2601869 RepID=A0A6N6JK64_9RHOB|nr:hypothetical protein [Litoreibacter roseus]GFE65582.1 hypothetical protein KIN_26560 [Litoreibacter roseus]